MPRGSVLAGSLVISIAIGSVLGRAYQSRVESEPVAAAGQGGDEALLAQALGFEDEPTPPHPVPEASAERRAQVAQHMGEVARTGQAALRSRLPLMPKAGTLVPIGDQLDAHGVPMNLSAYETSSSMEEVMAFYARHFEAQAWPYTNVPSAKAAVPYPALSATLLEEGLQLTVMVMPHGEDSGNTVVLGLADMEAFRKNAEQPENTGDLPPYPGTAPLAVLARDEGIAALTVSFDTPDEPQAVEDFYRKALAQRGYSEVADPQPQEQAGSGLRTLRFASRQGRSWNVALSSQGKGTAVTAHGSHVPEATP
jgi:hypothetical protein